MEFLNFYSDIWLEVFYSLVDHNVLLSYVEGVKVQ